MRTLTETEKRVVKIGQLRVHRGADGKAKLEGYAAVFDSMSEDLGFREIIRPGAFTNTLKRGDDVRALIDHDPSKPLGRLKAGTLRLEEDSRGLKATIFPPDTTYARDVITSIERGDVDQMSFGFRTVRDQWRTEDGQDIRELLEADLDDVSIVTFPAYPDTTIALRGRSKWREKRQVTAESFEVTPFADLPIVDEPWNPDELTDAQLINDILGDDGNDWAAMKQANLTFAPGEEQGGDPPTQANAYKLKVARRRDGELTVFFPQLANRVGVINGGQGGVDVPDSVRQDAFDHAMRYYDKLEIPEEDRPTFETRAHLDVRGQVLGNALSDAVDELVMDERPRADIIQELADAAGIAPGTVNQILGGAIVCPPPDRIEAFAGVLGLSMSGLADAAISDGCDPDTYSSLRSASTMEVARARLRLAQSK